jgi:hypothetical protein
VTIEVRVIAAPPYTVEKHLKGASPFQLDQADLRELLGDVQGQTHASCPHFLKMTVATGQRCALHADNGQESEVDLSLLAAVSADRLSVRLFLKANLPPRGPFLVWQPTGQIIGSFGPPAVKPPKGKAGGVDEDFTLSDGRTAVFDAGTRTDSSLETSKVPILGDLPYVGWLFTKESWEKEEKRVLILVTPRILR